MSGRNEIPENLRDNLLHKINTQTFDLSNILTLCYDENCSFHKYYNIATQEIKAFQDIFLVDHIWSFENPDLVREQLRQSKQLQEIMATILNLPIEQYQDNIEQLLEDIWKEMWLYVSSYDNSNGQITYFIQDQIGCGFLPSCEKIPQKVGLNLQYPKYATPFESCVYHATDGTTYSVVWPVRDIEENEPLLCSSMNLSLISRIALLKVVDCEPFISTEDYGILIEEPEVALGEEEGNQNEGEREEEGEQERDDGDDDIMDPHHLSFPSVITSEEAKIAIQLLSTLLSSSEYSVQSITSTLQLSGFDVCLPVWELSSPKYQQLMYSRLRSHLETHQFSPSATNLCCLISLFCLGISLPLNEALDSFGSSLLSSLLKLGVLSYQSSPTVSHSIALSPAPPQSGVVLSLIQITPSFHLNSQLTLFFMTDFSHHSSYSSASIDSSSSPETYFEPVMYVGPDSLALFQSISPPNTNADGAQPFFPSTSSRALDVFCGCGIQGITALKINLVNKVTFVEKNHRAVRFLRFNLLLNGVPLERAEVIHDSVQNIHSHLSSPSSSPSSLLSQQTQFQLILANPPYIPTGLLSKKASQETSERGLLGYGAGGADGEEFIAFVYTDLIRYLALPPVSSSAGADGGCAVGGPSGVYLVSNLVNVHQYPAKLSQWITQSSRVSGNAEFLNQLTQHKLLFSGFISHDKPWTPHQYAQLILDRSSSASEVNPKVDQYAQDLTEIGIESVCNGLVFLKLHAVPVSAAPTAVSIVETRVEECPEQVWQLLNLPDTLKERYLEIQQKISQYRI